MFKRLIKSIIAAVVYPIATVVSFPKLIRMMCDNSMSSTTMTAAQFDFKVITKYKITPSYCNSHPIIYISAFVLCLGGGFVSGLLGLMSIGQSPGTSIAVSQGEVWNTIGMAISCIPSLYGFGKTLFGYDQNNTSLLSAVDEVLYPIRRLCNRNPKRLIHTLILHRYFDYAMENDQRISDYREAVEFRTKEGLDLLIANSHPRPNLNQELLQYHSLDPNALIAHLNAETPLPKVLNELIIDYVAPRSLQFLSSQVSKPRELNVKDITIDITDESDKLHI